MQINSLRNNKMLVFISFCLGLLIGIWTQNSFNNFIAITASLATVAGFILALLAYLTWIAEDTIRQQIDTIRKILLELTELEVNLINFFDYAAYSINENEIPNSKNEKYFIAASTNINRLEILKREYESLDINPSKNRFNLPIANKIYYTDSHDTLNSLKNTLHKVKLFIAPLRIGAKLAIINNELVEITKPKVNDCNYFSLFDNSRSYKEISDYFIRNIEETRRQLIEHIK